MAQNDPRGNVLLQLLLINIISCRLRNSNKLKFTIFQNQENAFKSADRKMSNALVSFFTALQEKDF